MNKLKHFYKANKVVVILAATMFLYLNIIRPWKPTSVISSDTRSYYGYIPATFIYHDLSLKFIDNKPEAYADKFYYSTTPNGGRIMKMSMGLSILYFPFFLLGHIYTLIFGGFEANGFTLPYQVFLCFGSIFYMFIGLLYLRKVLLNYFTELVTSITLIAIVLATNVWNYTTWEPTMSHSFNFALFSLFLHLTIKFFNKPSIKISIAYGLLTGLISLIRPSNAIIILIPLLYNVYNWETIKAKLTFIKVNIKYLLIIILCILLIWAPQIAYWKLITGQYFYYSYSDEGFFFKHPQIIKGLFSYRKGWFVYTPLAVFFVWGMIYAKKYIKEFYFGIILFTLANFYIIFSWWCWWYGGSFGMRPLIESYALLSLSLASFITVVFKSRFILIKIIFATALIFLTYLNQFQCLQYRKTIIHWDSMSKGQYWELFLKYRYAREGDKLIEVPDYEGAKHGHEKEK